MSRLNQQAEKIARLREPSVPIFIEQIDRTGRNKYFSISLPSIIKLSIRGTVRYSSKAIDSSFLIVCAQRRPLY